MSTTVQTATEIRPFHVDIAEEAIDERGVGTSIKRRGEEWPHPTRARRTQTGAG